MPEVHEFMDPPKRKINPVKKNLKIKKVKPHHRNFRRVPMSAQLPICQNAAQPMADRSHPENVVTAILKRAGTKPPQMRPEIKKLFRTFVRKWCEDNMKRITMSDVDFYDWIEKTNYSRARKDELIKVWEDHPYDDPGLHPEGTKVKSFIKAEFYDIFKFARGINARDDWFKTYCGPVFDAIFKQMFHEHDEFIKTVPVLQRPNILQAMYQANRGVFNNDAESYEAHFENDVKDNCENVLYTYMTEECQWLKQRMENIIKILDGVNVMDFKYIQAEITSTRMSGEMNTSGGNGFTTLMVVLFCAWLCKAGKVETEVEGDDNVSTYQFEHNAPTRQMYYDLGWLMKVERPADVFTASFCGNIFDTDDQVIVTDPRPQIANLGWCPGKYINSGYAVKSQLLRAKALSLCHQYNGCPMLGHLGNKIVRLTSHITIRQSIIDNWGMYRKEQLQIALSNPIPELKEPTMATRFLVQNMYGISIQEQLNFERDVELLVMGCQFQVFYNYSNLWDQNYSWYTSKRNEEWNFPVPYDPTTTMRTIASFGKTTKAFVSSYYEPQLLKNYART